MREIFSFVLGLAIVGSVFYLVEHLTPDKSDKPLWREDSSLDLIYLVSNPLFMKSLVKIFVFGALFLTAFLLGLRFDGQLFEGFGPLKAQPLPLIIFELLFVGDFLTYWLHRALHGRSLWKIHAIHHSSGNVDWLSSARVHPLNQIFTRMIVPVVFLVLGMPLKVVAFYAPVLTLWGIFLHSNVKVNFGVFKYFISTPAFHRWHHAKDEEAIDKNFAGFFPIFDIIFGTYYLPEHSPEEFGVQGSKIPNNYLGQLLYPFHKY